ncbi:Oidioi.mRNA.OKI2018_I69.XSR.g16707.t1.cds [Oikopleura dioica]|uniref:Oidioi.mRNA.OKI2018_I69.XSR.g16707.t1.cds n=1 Tax=Oikopleura dioica TaxID=34765 RepID=A0ABN7SH06_OIKDI|nr:Oidioi.mRNA.OKI2018_I69.XSR.g16707.t1.cds [Oikopleura dioica]
MTDPLKYLNRGPEYLRNAIAPPKTSRVKRQLSAAERLNIQKPTKREQAETNQLCTAESLFQKPKGVCPAGYAARLLSQNASSGADSSLKPSPRRPTTAQPYCISSKHNRRLQEGSPENRKLRTRSNSLDKFFDSLGGTLMPQSNPPSIVPSGSVSDLSGLSMAASQLIRSASSSTLDDDSPLPIKSPKEVSVVDKRIRVMMWLSKCKPAPVFSTPVKG